MIYLDHNATTPMHPNVIKKIQEVLSQPLNPSSIHSYGRKGKSYIEAARKNIASLVGISKNFKDYQITFTASGTEANNLILSNFKNGEIFISATEHPSIFAHYKMAKNITLIKVDSNGVLDLEDLNSKLESSKAERKLLSVMLANNETGIIQPIKQIADITHKNGALIHSDCVQAAGKIDIDLLDLNVDFISISAHKFGGPMGAAALISKASLPLQPLIIGGGQEKGLRAGTENVLAIIGFGEAALLAKNDLEERSERLNKLRLKLEKELLNSTHNIEIVGMHANRLPNTSLIINPAHRAETQLIALDLRGVALSSGSACSSGRISSSHVLDAMEYSKEKMDSALRISLGWNTTEQDIDNFFEIYNEINK